MCDKIDEMPEILLAWYDTNARHMPWRVAPAAITSGAKPDPYHVWLSEIMLQQTTVVTVVDYFHKFVSLWPTIQDLAAAPSEQVMAAWAGLGYYARARNLLKCARVVVADWGGVFPTTQQDLLGLPGIGPYTAAAIGAIAFDQPVTVLDGNVERVMARLYRVEEPLPASKEDLRAFASQLTPLQRPGDYAQAVMDLGATVCTPRQPNCSICPWSRFCQARISGDAVEFPKKTPKKPKPIRRGMAYVVTRQDGALLLERRPDKGLLGGMLGWPGSEWTEEETPASPPVDLNWQVVPTEVRHTFTHFHLRLKILTARVSLEHRPEQGHFIAPDRFEPSDLPTVMRKVWQMAQDSTDNF